MEIKYFNRYHHCGETFYTGTNIKTIQCSECGENTRYEDIIKTKDDLNDKNVDILETFKNEEEL